MGGFSRPHVTHHHHHGGGWGGGPRRFYGGGGCGSGLFGVVFVVIVLIFLLRAGGSSILFSSGSSYSFSSGDTVASTKERTPLSAGSVTETDYITDLTRFISSKSTAENGMKKFFQRTGIQPHLYITDAVNGSETPSDSELDAFTAALYGELFSDQAHFLVVMLENYSNDDYVFWYKNGAQVDSIMDTEALEIFNTVFGRYYYDNSLSADQFVSRVFDESSAAIMGGANNASGGGAFGGRTVLIVLLIVGGVVAVLFLLFTWWNKSKQQKKLEDERTERILNSDLETFGDAHLEKLEEKYESNDNDK
ncbi:MAG: hypothetical protein LBR83_06915 [Clostridiales bacterium]|nr:hypothetical protein [Clostridiales bacterium]